MLIDHVLAIVFAVGFPALTAPAYARRRPLLRAGHSETKRREYRETVLWLSGMGLATLLVWIAVRRDLMILGLSFTVSWKSILGLAVAGGAAALLFLQVRVVQRDARARRAARSALEPVREFLPVSQQELRLFRVVSLSAGIGEELFYRGFLIWYVAQLIPLLWAVVVSSVVFGLAHVMHGVAATVRATFMGVVLAGLFVFSGMLWPSMILHTAVDLSSGATGLAVARDESPVAA